MTFTAREIYQTWHIKPDMYRMVHLIGSFEGMSNQDIANKLNVSPQYVGRITTKLHELHIIEDKNETLNTLHRCWVVVSSEPFDSVSVLLKPMMSGKHANRT